MVETMVPIENLTDAELRTTVRKLRDSGENAHADQLEAFRNIGPIDQRREYWKWHTSKTKWMPLAIQTTPVNDQDEGDIWVLTEGAIEQHLIAALGVEKGARRAIIATLYKGLKPFFKTPATTVREALAARKAEASPV